MFNYDWMREEGSLEKTGMTARDPVASGLSAELFSVDCNEPVEHARQVMGENDFSQISVTHERRIIGSLSEMHLFAELIRNPDVRKQPIESIMQTAFPFVDVSTPVDLLATMITPQTPAVLVRDFQSDKTFIITMSDVMRVL